MEKTDCLVSIASVFEEEEKRYEGSFESSEDRIRMAWTQPEENKGEGETRFLMSYRVAEKTLRLSRKGSTEMDLLFREGEKTDGIMRTSHGDFDIRIETWHILFFPETGDEETILEGKPYLVKKAMLEYDLCFPNQEPMRNSMFFKLHIAK
ncbi:MAG: DUF1934 family protein [Clostridiales bacterium]|nr:DUF1934 family protein [Clostridiales bacterium]